MVNDYIGPFLREKYIEDYAFIHLTPDFIQKTGLDFMKNVPVPVKKEAIGAFATDQPIKMEHFVLAMVTIIGMDPNFRFAGVYIAFLKHINKNIFNTIMTVGVEFANDGHYEMAAIHFRAAYVVNDRSLAPLYNFMMACRELYQRSEKKDYTAAFKSQTNDALLVMTEKHPDFAMGFYYLGFSHINAGRYKEAQDAWFAFMEKSAPDPGADDPDGKASMKFQDERKEINERLEQLEDPVIIESGYKEVIHGDREKGMKVLESYIDTKFMDWWPLPYYLGIGYSRAGRYEEAIYMFKKVLDKNPSSPETMAELAKAYKILGNEELAEKYELKFQILKNGEEQEGYE